jgi:hypothetical protein
MMGLVRRRNDEPIQLCNVSRGQPLRLIRQDA